MEKENKKVVVSKQEFEAFYGEYNAKVKHFTKQYLSCPIEVLKVCSPRACILYMQILYKSNLNAYMSNTELAMVMNCTPRNIENIINELLVKGCITVFYKSKTVRYIYPNYVLPFVLDTSKETNKAFKASLNGSDYDSDADKVDSDGWRTL